MPSRLGRFLADAGRIPRHHAKSARIPVAKDRASAEPPDHPRQQERRRRQEIIQEESDTNGRHEESTSDRQQPVPVQRHESAHRGPSPA